jgi:hypothetical protein
MSEPEDEDTREAKYAAAFAKYLDAVERESRSAIAMLYGDLPPWFPEPALNLVRQSIASLRNAGQSDERIRDIVARERDCTLEVPGSARDPDDFYKSANYLAHVQWALELDPRRALTELAGQDAAVGWRLRQQRRRFSATGNETKKARKNQREQQWLTIGRPLRANFPKETDSWLAKQISKESGDKASTIRAALARLGLTRRK